MYEKKLLKNSFIILIIITIFLYFNGYRLSSFSAAKCNLSNNSSLVTQLNLNPYIIHIFKTDSYYISTVCKLNGFLWKKEDTFYRYNYSQDLVKVISYFCHNGKGIFMVENNDSNVKKIRIRKDNKFITKRIGYKQTQKFILDETENLIYWRELNATALSEDGLPLYEWKCADDIGNEYDINKDLRWRPVNN